MKELVFNMGIYERARERERESESERLGLER